MEVDPKTKAARKSEGGYCFPAEGEQASGEGEAPDSKSHPDFLRRLVEYTLDMISVLDAEGRVVYNSPSLTRYLGYLPEELEGRSAFELVHPEDLPRVLEAFRKGTAAPGVTEKVEYRYRHKDGSWRFLESEAVNLLHDPAVRGMVISSHDVSDRKRMEEELRESEEMHRSLVRASPDAVTVSDLEGNITYVSPQTLRLHGFEREEELLGLNAIRLAAREDRDKALAIYRLAINEGMVRNAELTALKKDGSRFPVELSVAVIRDTQGEPRGLVAFTRDISERKKMEMELRNRNEELEAFAHTISHDLLTPVAIVEGYAKAALEADAEGRPEAERECLEAIARGARRMSELINSLLQYAQAGHAELEELTVDSEEVLLEVLMDLEEEIQRKGASVRICDRLPVVRAEAVKLRQVFFNLIGNALKHMGEVEDPRVEIGAQDRGDMAVFRVSDNGVGIPSALQEQIFEPFKHFSMDGTPGLGIGLSTVKRAVRSWGGRIWVESSPGEGATFLFTVPVAGS
ncbi:PAS domain-containing sensor histidine kinase [Candidatus Solincola tengchongensis]|uniref:sensor histidine kinase n=1 Tax=Candidatus Solincola tengchongensis TaxID=2900693 RepID=UPI00257CA097|nr:PAS domain-containing sensor histidine kinase [Candidatus Solincola tengchongensis]